MGARHLYSFVMSLARSRGGKNYSLYFPAEVAEIVRSVGITHFRPCVSHSGSTVMSLRPCGPTFPRARKFQHKRGGMGHMEIPVAAVGKHIGRVGKGVDARVWVYQGGTLQVKRPRVRAILA